MLKILSPQLLFTVTDTWNPLFLGSLTSLLWTGLLNSALLHFWFPNIRYINSSVLHRCTENSGFHFCANGLRVWHLIVRNCGQLSRPFWQHRPILQGFHSMASGAFTMLIYLFIICCHGNMQGAMCNKFIKQARGQLQK